MVRLLRFIGLLNIALWLGASVFFTLGAAPAIFSEDMQTVLKRNYPYYSGAVAQVIIARYFRWHYICGAVALLHLLSEWLYCGRPPQKRWLWLLVGVLAAGLAGGLWLQPKLKELHEIKYAQNIPARDREAAAQSFRGWHGASQGINLLMLAGLTAYFWWLANPPDPARFVSSSKFRS